MSFNTLRGLTRKRLARAVVGILLLAGAAFAEYGLANIPRPVNLDTTGKFSPATIKLGQEELVIEGPVIDSAEGLLFSHNGRANEVVEASFGRARLAEETIGSFESVGSKPPSTPANIEYRAEEAKSPPAGHEPCRTRVELCVTSKMPAELHLSQRERPGGNHYRYLEMTARGAEIVSHLETHSPNGSYVEPGCQKRLSVGDWNHSITVNVTTIVDENSSLRLYFRPVTPESTPWADADGFLPFDVGVSETMNPDDPRPFEARAVSIRSLIGGNSTSGPPTLSAMSTGNGPLLTISDLRIGSDQLHLSVVGKGWVKINGKDETVSLLKLVTENPLLATLLGAANAALLALVARLILKSSPASP